MIFILHYLLFNAGLPATIVLLTLFLQTHSAASLSEIGALLMALPFLSILTKPLFCALADRRQAHKAYLMGALGLMALGYGSLAVAPFFPELVREHGRLVWWLDVAGVLVGFTAFGVVWSLGDALAVNAAQVNGVSWGFYRVWGVVSWGAFGVIIGQINELPWLPKYVPGFLVLVAALACEMVLLACWPDEHFDMTGERAARPQLGPAADHTTPGSGDEGFAGGRAPPEAELSCTGSGHSLGGSLGGTATARTTPRLVGAVANVFMEDLGGTLRSSLKLGRQRQRMGLAEMLKKHRQLQLEGGSCDTSFVAAEQPRARVEQAEFRPTATPQSESFGRAALRRAHLALSAMNSLSSQSGTAIATELRHLDAADCSGLSAAGTLGKQRRPVMYMSSLASNTSLSRAAAARALAFGGAASLSTDWPAAVDEQRHKTGAEKPADGAANLSPMPRHKPLDPQDLQLDLLKLIVRRDTNIWRYLVVFTVFGVLLTLHLSYFFLHLRKLCQEHGADFSSVTGGMMAAHSVSEVFSFTVVVPHYVPRVGRPGALATCAAVYAIRFAYYATYLATASPYTGIPFELCHGIVYGIIYSLITDVAAECVDHVDDYLPELVALGLVGADVDPQRLKLPLRATMQGVFSGAFDGLGNGIGALCGGLFLDRYPFAELWLYCTYVCLAVMVVYPLSEWRTLCARRRPGPAEQSDAIGTAFRPPVECK